MNHFLPHTDKDRSQMLEAIGLAEPKDLFADIPDQLKTTSQPEHMPMTGMGELPLMADLKALAKKNTGAEKACFLGGGAYNRYIPAGVTTIASRSEFYTAYTPYQPEIAQGTLQVTYEFQTMIAELTGMAVANASVYDAATAIAEAVLMAKRIKKTGVRVLVSDMLNPDYYQVLATYLQPFANNNTDDSLQLVQTDLTKTETAPLPADDVLCCVVQIPSYHGTLTDLMALRKTCDDLNALLIVCADPVALAVLEPPGKFGADIVVGDIQPLGNALSFGGPYGGYMATRETYLRQLPGRLVGKTVDRNNNLCYTLTLQAREQHIRRNKATSNICTNQALNILKATVYLSLMGPVGLKQVALRSIELAHQLAEGLTALPGITLVEPGRPFLFEFVIAVPLNADFFLNALSSQGILGGIVLKTENVQHILVCCTECNTPRQIEQYIWAVKGILDVFSAGLVMLENTSL
ncbi:MAG: aminomethyl-transferring glycine dehydrogenase subunit GcvPA [Cyanobacteria bacterium P01_H01_bin.74]